MTRDRPGATRRNALPLIPIRKVTHQRGIEAENSDSWEIGTDIRFFQNRLGIDIAYYQAKDYNNLENIPVSDASGYEGYLLNGNIYRRKGVEFTINATPVRNDNFRWDTQINFSQYRRYIDEIYGDKEYTEDR